MMRSFSRQPSRTLLGILLSAIGCIASGTALAGATGYVVINPIDVCAVTSTYSNGTTKTRSCPTFGMNCTTNTNGSPNCTAYNDPVAAAMTTNIATTPIGFVDESTWTDPATHVSTTNAVNVTRAMWLQAGIDVVFLPMNTYDSPTGCPTGPNCNTTPSNWNISSNTWWATGSMDYQTLHLVQVTCAATGVTTLVSPDFAALTNYTLPCGSPTPTVAVCPTCTSAPTLPPLYSDPHVINMFFVNTMADISPVSGTYYGFSWVNGNGIAIASNTFASPPRFDTLAHEIGHVLDLDHTTLGANTACTSTKTNPYQTQNGCNLMAAGSNSGSLFRIVPLNSDCTVTSSSSPGGALYDIDTALCGSLIPSVAQADQVLSTPPKGTTTSQQSMVLGSNFVNQIQNVPASATAGGGPAATTMATTATTTITAAASTSSAINFQVTYPPTASGFAVALILTPPNNFKFGNPAFSCLDATCTNILFSNPYILNGNNGTGNDNCIKPISGTPSNPCQEMDMKVTETGVDSMGNPTFDGSFKPGVTFNFSSVIVNKNTGMPATIADLQNNCVPLEPLTCLNLTYVFNDLFVTTSYFAPDTTGGQPSLTANPQAPNQSVLVLLANPANFPSIANQSPLPYPSIFAGNGIEDSHGKVCTQINGADCPPGRVPACSTSTKKGAVNVCD
jgi:hypothetical protein